MSSCECVPEEAAGNRRCDADDAASAASAAVEVRLRKVASQVRQLAKDTEQAHNLVVRGGGAPGNDDNGEDEEDSRASFHLGMELFGQVPSVVERTVQDKLRRVEEELNVLLRENQRSEAKGGGGGGASAKAAAMDGQVDENRAPQHAQDPGALGVQADELQSRIRVLRALSRVRADLDESLDRAVSSSSSASDPAQLAEAAALLRRAQACWEEAERDASAAAAAGSSCIYEQLMRESRAALRRQRADLIDRAKALWCVELASTNDGVGEGSLAVRAAPAALAAAYGASQVLGDDKVALMLRRLLQELSERVLRPALPQSPRIGSNGGGKKSSRGNQKPSVDAPPSHHSSVRCPWKCEEVSGPPKCQGRLLEWAATDDGAVAINSKHNSSGGDQESDDPTPHWKDALELWQRILEFVADRVLLRRPDLLQEVGDYLWAPPSATPPSLDLSQFGLEPRRLGDDTGILREPLLDALRETCVPTHLPAFELRPALDGRARRLRDVLEPFAASLVRMGYVTAAGTAEDGGDVGHGAALARFADSLEREYVDGRRCRILQGARHTIQDTDYHNTVRVGDRPYQLPPPQAFKSKSAKGGSGRGGAGVNLAAPSSREILQNGLAVFQLPCFNVSSTAIAAMEQCRAALDEAVEVATALSQKGGIAEAHPDSKPSALSALPAVLYRSAREVLDLFRAMVPVLYTYEIKSVPRTAAIFHNDCVYLAHHCLTLGLEFRHRLDAVAGGLSAVRLAGTSNSTNESVDLLRRSCLFVDMVPLFRDLADKALGKVLDNHAKELVEVVGHRIPLLGESLRSTELLAEWSDAEAALEAGLHHLKRLFQAWKPVLSQDILVRSLWYLADVVLTLFLEQVTVRARDISSAACQFASALFQAAQDGVLELVGGDAGSSRVLDKFSAVGRFFDMSLADVEAALTEGVFRSVTSPELSHLIVATFDESPKRKKLLDLLAKH